jgi:hypothetical protein
LASIILRNTAIHFNSFLLVLLVGIGDPQILDSSGAHERSAAELDNTVVAAASRFEESSRFVVEVGAPRFAGVGFEKIFNLLSFFLLLDRSVFLLLEVFY